MMTQLLITLVLTVLLFYLSLFEILFTRLSRVALRALADREKIPFLREIANDRSHSLLPIQFGIQLAQVGIAVLVTSLFLSSWARESLLGALLAILVLVSFFRLLLPRLLIRREPEELLLRLLPTFLRPYRVLQTLSYPLEGILRAAEGRGRAENSNREDETSEETIQAYLGVGEEEGIFEEEESELIQSALEFGSTLVREIMTPRNEMVAVEERATITELKNLMVSSKHSRIPVYRRQLDEIVGVVYMRNLLAYLDEGRGDSPITPLIHPAWIVPDTKKVSELLKEMQARAEHLAVVVNEYGSVSGLVTVEDLVEEIVGEIHDEDELQRVNVVKEEEGVFLVRGRADVEELEEALGLDLGELDVTTVSGLVVEHLGRVPAAGEKITLQGLSFEILHSDRRRIHSMRVRLPQESPSEADSIVPEGSDTPA